MLAARVATLACIATALGATPLRAQTVQDDVLLPNRVLGVALTHGYEQWDRYWEGERKRSNENIGQFTSRSAALSLAYGLGDRVTVMAMLPYVWNRATQGTLHEMHGLQDFQLAVKVRAFDAAMGNGGMFRAFLAGSAGAPATDYSPDFLPLSIGSASRRASARITLSYEAGGGWFVSGSAAHTWRANVTLDRDAYYTDGRLYLTSEVAMPDVLDALVTAGFRRGRLAIPVTFVQQNTLGGGDIRRQDMPFVSNRMNFTRLDAGVRYALPKPADLAVSLGAGRVLTGRNVGQSTLLTATVAYAVHF